MSLFLKLTVGALFLIYPLIIYFGLLRYELWQIAIVIGLLAGVRAFVFKNSESHMAKIGFYGSLILIGFSILSMIFNHNGWLKLYPISISLLSFFAFAGSLFGKKSMIQRFAEIREKNIDSVKQLYMRKLTIIWCVFFLVNASISTYTMLYTNFKQWVLYNGFISYILMGTLVVLELGYRFLIVKRR